MILQIAFSLSPRCLFLEALSRCWVSNVKDESQECQNSDALLAFAISCAVDQCDRPIFGTINFCPGKLADDVDMLVSTAVHELAHASCRTPLFFASFLYCLAFSFIFEMDMEAIGSRESRQ